MMSILRMLCSANRIALHLFFPFLAERGLNYIYTMDSLTDILPTYAFPNPIFETILSLSPPLSLGTKLAVHSDTTPSNFIQYYSIYVTSISYPGVSELLSIYPLSDRYSRSPFFLSFLLDRKKSSSKRVKNGGFTYSAGKSGS